MGVALPHPSGRPNMPGIFFIGHKLLDAKGILKTYETLVAILSNLNF